MLRLTLLHNKQGLYKEGLVDGWMCVSVRVHAEASLEDILCVVLWVPSTFPCLEDRVSHWPAAQEWARLPVQ